MADETPPKTPGEIATIPSAEQAEASPPTPSTPSSSTPTFNREKFRSIGNWAQRLFAVLGVIAVFAEIYHLVIKPAFLEGRSITAAYSLYNIAEATPIFDIAPLLRPEFAIAKRLVEVDLLIWNSGTQTIPESEVRRPVTIKVTPGSRIVYQRTGRIISEQPDSFNLKQVDPATYELHWSALEPDDFFETHLLIATDIDTNDIARIMSVDGLITGKVGVTLLDFDTSMEDRNQVVFVTGVLSLIGALLLLLVIIVATSWTEKRSKIVRVGWALLFSVFVLGGSAVLGGIGGPWIASSFYAVPKWAPVTVYPPYFLNQIQFESWRGNIFKKDYSSRWSK